jgi:Sporulation and spore germination
MNAKIKSLVSSIVSFLKNTGEKIQDTHPFIQIFSFLACVAVIFCIMLSVLFSPRMQRSIFFFPGINSQSTVMEIRYLPRAHTREARVERYVSELLLGPITPGLSPLFSTETSLVDCLVRKGTAYINLSSEVLDNRNGLPEYSLASEYFKKNVCTNFRSMDRIYLYFDGIEVYSEIPYVDAEVKK